MFDPVRSPRHLVVVAVYRRGVPVPGFENGFLPRGLQAGHLPIPGQPEDTNATTYHGHPCTLEEIHDALVTPHGLDSETRARLFDNMAALAKVVERAVPGSLYLVTGSFVTELVDPYVLHLVAVFSGDKLSSVSSLDQWLVKRLMDGRELELPADGPKLTSEYAVVYQHDHPEWLRALTVLAQVRNSAGYPTDEDREAGYLQFTLAEGGDFDDAISDLLAPAA